jgi:hypothetical protein
VKLFEGLNYAGAALSFVAGLGALAVCTGLVANLWLLLAAIAIYTVGQFFVLVSAVGLTGMRFTPKNVTALFVLYSLLSWWDLITVLLILPFIPITMILGPFMVLLLVLAGAALGMYLVEVVLGYDVQGYSSIISNAQQAGVALVIFVCASLVLWWHTGRGDDWVLDRAADWIVALRRRLQGMIEGIVQEYRRD